LHALRDKNRLTSGGMLATMQFRIFCIIIYFLYKNIKFKNIQNYIFTCCFIENWSLTLRDGHRLKMFEIRLLRKIFGLETEEVTGGWRKLHGDVFHNIYLLFTKYYYDDQIRKDEIDGICNMHCRFEKCIKESHFEDLDIDGRVILKYISRNKVCLFYEGTLSVPTQGVPQVPT
jgi:hypothetical protein